MSDDLSLDFATVEAQLCETQISTPTSTVTTATPRGSRRAKSGGGRPAAYRLADGTRVPSCTTITKRFSDSSGLVRWAWQQGLDGKNIDDARDQAAGIGANVHDAVERFVCGSTEEEARALLRDQAASDEDRAKACDGFAAFMEWWSGMQPEVLETEVPLVSERYRFGGTLDAIGRIGGHGARRLCLIDWKTSNGTIYSDYLCQLAAYALLWKEVRGQDVERFDLLRFSKNTGGFSHFMILANRMEPATRHFILLRKAYEYDRKVKDLLK